LPRGISLVDVFTAVEKPEGQCWPWPGATNSKGRGLFHGQSAPRLIFEMINGPLGDLSALHSCDNPACINPDHLFAGTQGDNMADAASKGRMCGRQKPGEDHPMAKLNTAAVMEIKALHKGGLKQKDIARHYNVSASQVHRIICGKRWNKVEGCNP
jgi:hypothetical protein